jgi:hypothetical protein
MRELFIVLLIVASCVTVASLIRDRLLVSANGIPLYKFQPGYRWTQKDD